MTSHLQSLQTRRAELLQRIAKIDELIMAEIDDVIAGHESNDRQRGGSVKNASESTASASGRSSEAEQGSTRKAARTASAYPAGVRTWSDKILHTLQTAGRGMTTGDIMKALKAAEGEGGSRVVPATINTTLQAMETKSKSIRAERGATGRKLHYPAGASGSTAPEAAAGATAAATA